MVIYLYLCGVACVAIYLLHVWRYIYALVAILLSLSGVASVILFLCPRDKAFVADNLCISNATFETLIYASMNFCHENSIIELPVAWKLWGGLR